MKRVKAEALTTSSSIFSHFSDSIGLARQVDDSYPEDDPDVKSLLEALASEVSPLLFDDNPESVLCVPKERSLSCFSIELGGLLSTSSVISTILNTIYRCLCVLVFNFFRFILMDRD